MNVQLSSEFTSSIGSIAQEPGLWPGRSVACAPPRNESAQPIERVPLVATKRSAARYGVQCRRNRNRPVSISAGRDEEGHGRLGGGSRTPTSRTRVATDAVLTDTAIVTSGGVPDTCYQRLVAAVGRAINEADPIRLLEAGAPTDEYSPEIAAILPRLAGVQDLSDVTDVLHEEFVHWFDQGIAGPREAYEEPARRIWSALLEYRDIVQ